MASLHSRHRAVAHLESSNHHELKLNLTAALALYYLFKHESTAMQNVKERQLVKRPIFI